MSARGASILLRDTNEERRESGDTVTPSFPYSHKRSESIYSLNPTGRRPSLRRANSVVRSSKDIIPLVLKAESGQAKSSTNTSLGHRRGLSIGRHSHVPTGATTAPATSLADPKKARPSSMFFERFFSGKEEDFVAPLKLKPDSSTRSFRTRDASQRDSQSPTRTAQCACEALNAKSEARLNARITNLEAERDTKDLTISMLSEQLVDKSQEIELLRLKLAGLERALAGELDSPMCTPSFDTIRPLHHSSSASGRDSAIGSSSSSGAQSPPLPPSTTHRSHKRVSSGSFYDTTGPPITHEQDVSYEELVDENEALKEEVVRLSNVLEDGLGALANLGI